MNSHEQAGLTLRGRAVLVSSVLDEGWKVAQAGEDAGVSVRAATSGWRASRPMEQPDWRVAVPDRIAAPHQTSLQERQRLEQLRR